MTYASEKKLNNDESNAASNDLEPTIREALIEKLQQMSDKAYEGLILISFTNQSKGDQRITVSSNAPSNELAVLKIVEIGMKLMQEVYKDDDKNFFKN